MKTFFENFRDAQRPFCTAIVAAAGQSNRMNGNDKLFSNLDGVPVLVRTLQALNMSGFVDEIVIATRAEKMENVSMLCKTYQLRKVSKVVKGGENRIKSVLAAALQANPKAKLLAIQDGARPLVTTKLINTVICKAIKSEAAAPAVRVKDTIKIAVDGIIKETPNRSSLFAVQTPQVFETDLLKAALQDAINREIPVTDDCSAVERLGKQIYLVRGEEENIKITTPTDLILANALLQERNKADD